MGFWFSRKFDGSTPATDGLLFLQVNTPYETNRAPSTRHTAATRSVIRAKNQGCAVRSEQSSSPALLLVSTGAMLKASKHSIWYALVQVLSVQKEKCNWKACQMMHKNINKYILSQKVKIHLGNIARCSRRSSTTRPAGCMWSDKWWYPQCCRRYPLGKRQRNKRLQESESEKWNRDNTEQRRYWRKARFLLRHVKKVKCTLWCYLRFT